MEMFVILEWGFRIFKTNLSYQALIRNSSIIKIDFKKDPIQVFLKREDPPNAMSGDRGKVTDAICRHLSGWPRGCPRASASREA